MNAQKTFASRQLRRAIETGLGELDAELRLGTARRHLDPRLALLDLRFAALMQLHHITGHTAETRALETEIEDMTRRVEQITELRVNRVALRVVR